MLCGNTSWPFLWVVFCLLLPHVVLKKKKKSGTTECDSLYVRDNVKKRYMDLKTSYWFIPVNPHPYLDSPLTVIHAYQFAQRPVGISDRWLLESCLVSESSSQKNKRENLIWTGWTIHLWRVHFLNNSHCELWIHMTISS